MISFLDDPAVPNDQDAVCVADRTETVRHDNARAPFEDLGDCTLDELFGLRVDGARRFVQHEDLRVGKDDACKRDQLLLPGGQPHAAFADFGVIALRLAFDEFVRMDHRRRAAYAFLVRIGSAEADVLADRAGE